MPVPLDCSGCGRAMTVKDAFAGKRVKCPGCQAVLTVPRPGDDAEDAAFAMLAQPEAEDEPPPAPRQAAPEPPPPPPRPAPKPPPGPPARKPLPIRFREGRAERRRAPRIVVSPAVAGGALAMIGAVVWFVVGLTANRVYIYPPIMFVLGLIAVVKGLLGHPEE
jgi:hypothetical protein